MAATRFHLPVTGQLARELGALAGHEYPQARHRPGAPEKKKCTGRVGKWFPIAPRETGRGRERDHI